MTMTAGDLKALSAQDLIRLFETLEAPGLEEMNGEFRATLLDQGSWLDNGWGRLLMKLSGRCLAKAFAPLSPKEGHGYNTFERRGAIVRKYRMLASVGPSLIDERPSYHLDYSTFNRGFTRTMHDEVRRIAEDLYLGMGRAGFTERQRRHLMPFLLEGPPEPFEPTGAWRLPEGPAAGRR